MRVLQSSRDFRGNLPAIHVGHIPALDVLKPGMTRPSWLVNMSPEVRWVGVTVQRLIPVLHMNLNDIRFWVRLRVFVVSDPWTTPPK